MYITSGTTFIPPADFNAASNLIECYGSGGDDTGSLSTYAPAGAAYASGANIPILPGHVVNIGIGTPRGSTTDTWFNATSLASAVSNGPSISVAAQGATFSASSGHPSIPGSAANSVGNTQKFSGGSTTESSSAGTGGGGAAGPNGNGANGAGVSFSGFGGGAGGANGGGPGGQGNSTHTEYGGLNRFGTGGPTTTGTNGTAGGGGSGGASGTVPQNGGNGSLDDVYGDGIHGPGSGGGGAGQGTFGGAANGGNAGGYGAGAGTGNFAGTNGTSSPGLIVVNYNPIFGTDAILKI